MARVEVTNEEAFADLEATRRDIQRLEAIVENLSKFINDPHEKERFLPFKAHLFLYEGLLRQAYGLREKIQNYLHGR